MATTTNYSWTTPDDTALVKDGAAAIRSLGTAIDTTVFNNAGAAIAKTIVDAKGDIIAATAADTVARLAVGANATVLTADSSTATGLKWAAPASSLQILQIVQGTYSTETSTTSSSLSDTGLTATITPSSTSNKILVLCTQAGNAKTATSALDNAMTVFLNRNGTSLVKIMAYAGQTSTNAEVNWGTSHLSYLDAPASTSALTYKTQFRREGTGGVVKTQVDSSVSTMTLLEISGV